MRLARLGIFLPAIVICSIAAGGAVCAQDLPPLSSEYAPGTVPRGFGTLPVMISPGVTGRPFRAEYNSRRLEPGPGGMETHEYHGIVARDSEGRFLRETVYPIQEPANARALGRSPGTNHVYAISDPVAKENLTWDDGPTKMIMKSSTSPHPMPEQPLDWCERAKQDSRFGHTVRGQSTTVEDLGERKIQGIVTRGCRGTTVISDPGNMKVAVPFTITDETWTSPYLRMTLVHTHNDPHGLNLIERFDNIVLGEPDPAIFQAPVDYKVNDLSAEMEKSKEWSEAEEFAITPDMPKPLLLAGPWEVDDPILGGGMKIGIFINIAAAREVLISGGAITNDVSEKYNAPLEFQFYQRIAGDEHGIWFEAGQVTQYVLSSWDGQRLRFKFKDTRPSKFAHPDFSLDLTFNQAQQVWTGDYSREGGTKQVRLERPGASSKTNGGPFVGTWTRASSPEAASVNREGCVQIMQSTDGAFMAWPMSSDIVRMGRNISASTGTVLEGGGKKWGITVEGGVITLDPGAYQAGGMRPAKFVGKLSADGTQIVGTYLSPHMGPQGQDDKEPRTFVMTKTSEETCIQVSVPQRTRQNKQ